jgi:RimJ/RimL family protein N-acetyltransferase
LDKCGFTLVGEAEGFANARGEEIEELLLELRSDEGQTMHQRV